MNEVTSRGIHKPQELSVCLSHVATKPGQRLAPFSILESFLCRRESGGEQIKCRQGKWCECCLLSPGGEKWIAWR